MNTPCTLPELKAFWNEYCTGTNKKQLAKLHGINSHYVDELLKAAENIYGKKIVKTQFIKPPVAERILLPRDERPTQKIVRPKAEYSNTSPYGVAIPGIKR